MPRCSCWNHRTPAGPPLWPTGSRPTPRCTPVGPSFSLAGREPISAPPPATPLAGGEPTSPRCTPVGLSSSWPAGSQSQHPADTAQRENTPTTLLGRALPPDHTTAAPCCRTDLIPDHAAAAPCCRTDFDRDAAATCCGEAAAALERTRCCPLWPRLPPTEAGDGHGPREVPGSSALLGRVCRPSTPLQPQAAARRKPLPKTTHRGGTKIALTGRAWKAQMPPTQPEGRTILVGPHPQRGDTPAR